MMDSRIEKIIQLRIEHRARQASYVPTVDPDSEKFITTMDGHIMQSTFERLGILRTTVGEGATNTQKFQFALENMATMNRPMDLFRHSFNENEWTG